ncbi:sigma-E factor regulatory protein RseB domain-containing protein [Thermomonospora amylolytica]|uniref:sigma-E factor regulatory protein RseB domain-containing protein n=1 Tax=Thermomonospora amylolytica TaxID=1411117 RepID=UPI000E6C818C|nr:sigma-E factor regulatory protein RseB domain-containing protein [Thermomonospora amylolytica]
MSQAFAPPAPFGRRGPWVVGGLAAALLLAWTLAGDVRAGRRADSDPEALDLLRGTAAAARATPYEGTQTRTAYHSGAPVRTVVTVRHAPGGATLVGDASPVRAAASATGSLAGAAATAGGLTGFTPETLDLLARNYTVVRAADGLVCRRRAKVVEARRADGSAAGRFWIDAETGLMLRRELLDETGWVVAAAGFAELRITAPQTVLMSAAAPAPAAPWAAVAAAEVAELRAAGWPVPDELPGGFALQGVRRSGASDGHALHLGYTDGLADVSVFVQRGRLDARRLAGWRRTGSGGRTVFRREGRQRWAVWGGDGYVYTVLTDAPQSASDAVVAAFPHGAGWPERLRRGASRIGTWANPWN